MNRFLERIRIGQYGAFSDYDVGPFKPGLNVVYGPNEAGKSTIAARGRSCSGTHLRGAPQMTAVRRA